MRQERRGQLALHAVACGIEPWSERPVDERQRSGCSTRGRTSGPRVLVPAQARCCGTTGLETLVCDALIFSAVTERQTQAGLATADALATGLARAALFLTIMSAAGVGLALFVGPHRPAKPRPVDLSAATASSTHTIPTPQSS